MKTSELTGAALDWAVAMCEGWKYSDRKKIKEFQMQQLSSAKHCYSSVWAKGGPIIEREMIELVPCTDSLWDAMYRDQHIPSSGPTPLIAAMRCYVASKLGNEVEVPQELI